MGNMLKNHRDLLSILLGVIVLPGIWVLQGLGLLNVPEIVLGATVSIETMIAIFYFRKKGGGNGSAAPTP